jgi:hypothetical protein
MANQQSDSHDVNSNQYTACMIFRQTSLPKFPSDCVVGGQRRHRSASLRRLADENAFFQVLPDMIQTIHWLPSIPE